jgi:hypothetical protein
MSKLMEAAADVWDLSRPSPISTLVSHVWEKPLWTVKSVRRATSMTDNNAQDVEKVVSNAKITMSVSSVKKVTSIISLITKPHPTSKCQACVSEEDVHRVTSSTEKLTREITAVETILFHSEVPRVPLNRIPIICLLKSKMSSKHS